MALFQGAKLMAESFNAWILHAGEYASLAPCPPWYLPGSRRGWLPVIEDQSTEGTPDWSFHAAVGHIGPATSWSAAGAIQVTVDRGPADPERGGGRGHRVLPGGVHLLGHLQLVAITGGRPRWRPRARAAASPAAVRSLRSRSNSARAAKTWKTSLPPGVVVSIVSCRLRKPTPHSARPVTVSTRWRSERPRRSSFQTTSGGLSQKRSYLRQGPA
jgi:hypothetical protein